MILSSTVEILFNDNINTRVDSCDDNFFVVTNTFENMIHILTVVSVKWSVGAEISDSEETGTLNLM